MKPVCTALAIFAATAALAHEGVKNPAVLARMQGMKDVATEVKVLGDMAKGVAAFDRSAARAAAVSIARHAAEAPALFEAPEDDPKSESLPTIWESFDDFTAKSLEMERVARDLSTTISSAEDLGPGLQRLGATCTSCHEIYRKEP